MNDMRARIERLDIRRERLEAIKVGELYTLLQAMLINGMK